MDCKAHSALSLHLRHSCVFYDPVLLVAIFHKINFTYICQAPQTRINSITFSSTLNERKVFHWTMYFHQTATRHLFLNTNTHTALPGNAALQITNNDASAALRRHRGNKVLWESRTNRAYLTGIAEGIHLYILSGATPLPIVASGRERIDGRPRQEVDAFGCCDEGR